MPRKNKNLNHNVDEVSLLVYKASQEVFSYKNLLAEEICSTGSGFNAKQLLSTENEEYLNNIVTLARSFHTAKVSFMNLVSSITTTQTQPRTKKAIPPKKSKRAAYQVKKTTQNTHRNPISLATKKPHPQNTVDAVVNLLKTDKTFHEGIFTVRQLFDTLTSNGVKIASPKGLSSSITFLNKAGAIVRQKKGNWALTVDKNNTPEILSVSR